MAENEQRGEEEGLDSQAGVMEVRSHVGPVSKRAVRVRSKVGESLRLTFERFDVGHIYSTQRENVLYRQSRAGGATGTGMRDTQVAPRDSPTRTQ